MGYTRIHIDKDTQGYTRIHKDTQGYIRVHYFNYTLVVVPNTEAALPCWSACKHHPVAIDCTESGGGKTVSN